MSVCVRHSATMKSHSFSFFGVELSKILSKYIFGHYAMYACYICGAIYYTEFKSSRQLISGACHFSFLQTYNHAKISHEKHNTLINLLFKTYLVHKHHKLYPSLLDPMMAMPLISLRYFYCSYV